MHRSILVSALILGASALDGRAAETVLMVDPAASSVTFTLDATMHEVHGTIPLTSGEIRFDPETGSASGEVRVDAAGAVTGNKGRDKKMHAEVLESGRFPSIVFRAARIAGPMPAAGHAEPRIEGALTLHGADHPLSVSALVDVADGRVDATASFPIPYVAWGLADPSVFVLRVAKSVDVRVHIVGRIAPAEPVDSKPVDSAH